MITETIDVTSEAQAERAIDRFMERVRDRTDDLAQVLAEEIQTQCEDAYAMQAGAGNTATVTIGNIEGGRSVTAAGHDVEFLEFGAGVTTDAGHPWAAQVGDVYPGSWSQTHAQQFSRQGFWTYGGQQYTGLEATRGLLNAYDDVSGLVAEIADGVFE